MFNLYLFELCISLNAFSLAEFGKGTDIDAKILRFRQQENRID